MFFIVFSVECFSVLFELCLQKYKIMSKPQNNSEEKTGISSQQIGKAPPQHRENSLAGARERLNFAPGNKEAGLPSPYSG
jgi:hypothetical protein